MKKKDREKLEEDFVETIKSTSKKDLKKVLTKRKSRAKYHQHWDKKGNVFGSVHLLHRKHRKLKTQKAHELTVELDEKEK